MAIKLSRRSGVILGVIAFILLLGGTLYALLMLTDLGDFIGIGSPSASEPWEQCPCGGLNEGWCDVSACTNNPSCSDSGYPGAPCDGEDPVNGGCEASQYHCSNTGSCIPENQCPSGGGNQQACNTCVGSCGHTGCNVQCEGINPAECGFFSQTHYCRGQRNDGCNATMGFDQTVFPGMTPAGPFIGNGGSNVEVGQNVNLSYTPPGGSPINITTSTWCSTVQADSNAPNGAYSIVYIGDNGQICAEIDDGNGNRIHRDANGGFCNPSNLDWDCSNDPPDEQCPGNASARCLSDTQAVLTWTNSSDVPSNQILRLDSDPTNNLQCMGVGPEHFQNPSLPRYVGCQTVMCYNPSTGSEAPAVANSSAPNGYTCQGVTGCPNGNSSCVVGCPVGWACVSNRYCLANTSCELFDQYLVTQGTQDGRNPASRTHTVNIQSGMQYAWSIQNQDSGCRIDVGNFSCGQGIPQDGVATVTGRVYCQDSGSSTSYPVAGATVTVQTAEGPIGVVTDSSGNYSANVQVDQGGSESLGVRVSTVGSGSLSTGQSYASMVPNGSTPSTGASFAVNCSTVGATGCTGSSDYCGPNNSLGSSGSYGFCTVNEGAVANGLDFRFTNCGSAAPPTNSQCGGSCSTDANCSGDLVCSGGMCVNDACPVDQQDDQCLCETENPDWNMAKNHDISCQADGSASSAVVRYTIRVSNVGNVEGVLPMIVDTLDADINMAWVSASSITPSYGVIVGRTIVWEIPVSEQTFDPGETRDFTYTVVYPEQYYGTYDNTVEAFPEVGEDFTAEDSVDVTDVFCPPGTPTSPPLPDTAIFNIGAIGKVLIGLLIVGASLFYLKSDRYDVWFMRLMNKNERLDYTKERFEKGVEKGRSKKGK